MGLFLLFLFGGFIPTKGEESSFLSLSNKILLVRAPTPIYWIDKTGMAFNDLIIYFNADTGQGTYFLNVPFPTMVLVNNGEGRYHVLSHQLSGPSHGSFAISDLDKDELNDASGSHSLTFTLQAVPTI